MMKFFRKHKKAVSPVIAVMLLVAVAAVGAYFIWFRSFQAQTQGAVQDEASGALGTQMQVISIANDESQYYIVLRNAMTENAAVTSITRSGEANTTTTTPVATITAGNTGTMTFNPTTTPAAQNPTRGKTWTFTINYTYGTANGVLVHTYTDA